MNSLLNTNRQSLRLVFCKDIIHHFGGALFHAGAAALLPDGIGILVDQLGIERLLKSGEAYDRGPCNFRSGQVLVPHPAPGFHHSHPHLWW